MQDYFSVQITGTRNLDISIFILGKMTFLTRSTMHDKYIGNALGRLSRKIRTFKFGQRPLNCPRDIGNKAVDFNFVLGGKQSMRPWVGYPWCRHTGNQGIEKHSWLLFLLLLLHARSSIFLFFFFFFPRGLITHFPHFKAKEIKKTVADSRQQFVGKLESLIRGLVPGAACLLLLPKGLETAKRSIFPHTLTIATRVLWRKYVFFQEGPFLTASKEDRNSSSFLFLQTRTGVSRKLPNRMCFFSLFWCWHP